MQAQALPQIPETTTGDEQFKPIELSSSSQRILLFQVSKIHLYLIYMGLLRKPHHLWSTEGLAVCLTEPRGNSTGIPMKTLQVQLRCQLQLHLFQLPSARPHGSKPFSPLFNPRRLQMRKLWYIHKQKENCRNLNSHLQPLALVYPSLSDLCPKTEGCTVLSSPTWVDAAPAAQP